MKDKLLMLTPHQATEACGWELPKELFKYRPLGHRLMVALPKAQRQLKSGLFVPDAVADRQRLGKGTVIAVGELVGDHATWHWPGIFPFPREQLLGKQITFGYHVGYAVYMSESDDEFHSDVVLINDCDIQMLRVEED